MTKQDIDLQKIQVLESSYQAWFNFRASILTTFMISLLILVLTFLVENVITLSGFFFAYGIVAIFMFICLMYLRRQHEAHTQFMNEAIARIENGKKLESVTDLEIIHDNWTKKKAKASDAKT